MNSGHFAKINLTKINYSLLTMPSTQFRHKARGKLLQHSMGCECSLTLAGIEELHQWVQVIPFCKYDIHEHTNRQ